MAATTEELVGTPPRDDHHSQRRTLCVTKQRSTQASYVKRAYLSREWLPRHDPRHHGAERTPRHDTGSGRDVSGCRHVAECLRELVHKQHVVFDGVSRDHDSRSTS
jgi:hypothetical protein